eukprot:TRINITY_DN643_c0_g1_i1.p1 TRINITY_DN643_c0_g1~~TRINITY_DN643_c0_g1_i1.p1  ORF type:complete len:223 (+),score=50.53 TRINITY_DN643_c0_g1_i1:29-670(+)
MPLPDNKRKREDSTTVTNEKKKITTVISRAPVPAIPEEDRPGTQHGASFTDNSYYSYVTPYSQQAQHPNFLYPGTPVVSFPDPPKSLSTQPQKRSKKKFFRKAAGQAWEDATLQEWDEDDFRIFVGDLGNEVNDEMLKNAFMKYPSFQKAKVLRDKRTGKTKGFAFVSFSEPLDFAKALREMNGKYIGNRPVKLRKSKWKERNDGERMGKKAQ